MIEKHCAADAFAGPWAGLLYGTCHRIGDLQRRRQTCVHVWGEQASKQVGERATTLRQQE